MLRGEGFKSIVGKNHAIRPKKWIGEQIKDVQIELELIGQLVQFVSHVRFFY